MTDAWATLGNLPGPSLAIRYLVLIATSLKSNFVLDTTPGTRKKEGTENRHRKGNIPVNQTMCLKNIVNFNRKSLKSNRFKLDQNNKSGWLHIFDSQGKETEML